LHLRVIDSGFIPLFDRVWNDRRLLQCVAVEELGNPRTGRCIGEPFIGDRADDFVTVRPVGACLADDEQPEEN
jgi:hypothetical protein